MIKVAILTGIFLSLVSFGPLRVSGHYSHKKVKLADVASISTVPANPLIEKDQYGQHIIFDITIKNTGTHTLDLSAIEASVMNALDKPVARKSINNSGQQPGIKTLGNTIIRPGEAIRISNPFNLLAADLSITFLQYEFFFNYADSQKQQEANRHRLPTDFDASIKKVITPRILVIKTSYSLPLKDKILVLDGHDFLSHHRRFPAGLPEREAKDIIANSNRDAYELVIVDEKGNMYRTDPFKKESWYVFGKPVYAPAGGLIVEAQNTIPDNEFIGKTVVNPKIPADVDPFGMGNHIIIDHGNGEFSELLHLEKGSLKVKAGDRVKPGQLVGAVGFSGDATSPHLHYTVMNGPNGMVSKGLPSYFNNFKLYRGNSFILVKKGRVDSGNIVESEK
ncbi:MAG: peptidoglycan DD-metalloendopeptidase family protein [Mucilaginibacter sp.]